MSEFVYELPKNRVVLKCPVCGLSGLHLHSKRDAAFTVSREYVVYTACSAFCRRRNRQASCIQCQGYLASQFFVGVWIDGLRQKLC